MKRKLSKITNADFCSAWFIFIKTLAIGDLGYHVSNTPYSDCVRSVFAWSIFVVFYFVFRRWREWPASTTRWLVAGSRDAPPLSPYDDVTPASRRITFIIAFGQEYNAISTRRPLLYAQIEISIVADFLPFVRAVNTPFRVWSWRMEYVTERTEWAGKRSIQWRRQERLAPPQFFRQNVSIGQRLNCTKFGNLVSLVSEK